LSIVAAIATAHAGSLVLQARDRGGLRVLIDLPDTQTTSFGPAGLTPTIARVGAP
jgi:hypothetical protein